MCERRNCDAAQSRVWLTVGAGAASEGICIPSIAYFTELFTSLRDLGKDRL